MCQFGGPRGPALWLDNIVRPVSKKRLMIATLKKGNGAKASSLKKFVYGRETRQYSVVPWFHVRCNSSWAMGERPSDTFPKVNISPPTKIRTMRGIAIITKGKAICLSNAPASKEFLIKTQSRWILFQEGAVWG